MFLALSQITNRYPLLENNSNDTRILRESIALRKLQTEAGTAESHYLRKTCCPLREMTADVSFKTMARSVCR